MDPEAKLIERWRRERPMYEAWGQIVTDTLMRAIEAQIHPVSAKLFCRIPIKHRTKDEQSFLAKAFVRKSYSDPYNDIEDKVGLRVVVLCTEDIATVKQIIETLDIWDARVARDFEKEISDKPLEFNYQSLHYIVRGKIPIAHDDVTVEPNTPCEVQVRTLLQHAYAELTHDTIYKPSVKADPAVHRAAAKSMALIEATDDYFLQVRKQVAAMIAPSQELATMLLALYQQFTNTTAVPTTLDTLLIDFYKQYAPSDFKNVLNTFLSGKPFLGPEIASRAASSILFRQPSILLVYWAINVVPLAAASGGPLSMQELAPLYSDLGIRAPI
jgi:putative GTP pyrophosphokinase